MEAKASIIQVCFIPSNLILWQCLKFNKIIDYYGERLSREILEMMLTAREEKNEKKEIKYE
jgi:hypothetical protein